MEVGSFGMLDDFCHVAPCLFVYFSGNYEAGFPFFSFRAPAGLLGLNDGLAYPSWDGWERLSLSLVHAC